MPLVPGWHRPLHYGVGTAVRGAGGYGMRAPASRSSLMGTRAHSLGPELLMTHLKKKIG